MLDQLVFWHWLVLAVVLGIIEILTFTTFFLWIAIAALVTGVLKFMLPGMSPEIQILLFAIGSVMFTILGRMYFIKRPIKSDSPLLNKRNEQYIGRTFTLTEPVVNGLGSVKVDDSTWRIRGADLAVGETVKITGVDGVILEFEKVTPS